MSTFHISTEARGRSKDVINLLSNIHLFLKRISHRPAPSNGPDRPVTAHTTACTHTTSGKHAVLTCDCSRRASCVKQYFARRKGADANIPGVHVRG